jgi:hypothetical protein
MNRSNKGALWLAEEMQQLKREFGSGLSLKQICEAHDRTPYGVINKLIQLGLLTQIGKAYHAVLPDPWVLLSVVVELQDNPK